MLKPENQRDKARFKQLKRVEKERGLDEDSAIEVAAHQVKHLRRREGRSKESARR